MAATGSEIRRLAADVAARSQAPGHKAIEQQQALSYARVGLMTMPILIFAVLFFTAALSASAIYSGGFLGFGGLTALGMVALVGAILMNTVWLRAPRINGLVLGRKEAPELHAIIDEAAKELESLRPGTVIISDGLAVKLHQVPNLGLLAGTGSILEIGLPAIQTYSRSELGVLITLELARFGNNRDAQERQIERMADLWTGVTAPQARSMFSMDFIAGGFAHWLAPRIAKAARGIRASGILVADRAAAELIGAYETGMALQRRVIANAFLDEYWHRLAEEPITTPTPSFFPYREMADFMPRLNEWEQAEAALRLALVNRVLEAGAEPPLWQRLKAIGTRPAIPPMVHDAATILLGASYERVVQHFDKAWQRANQRAWTKAYAAAKAAGMVTVTTPATAETVDEVVTESQHGQALETVTCTEQHAAEPSYRAEYAAPQPVVAEPVAPHSTGIAVEPLAPPQPEPTIDPGADAAIPSVELAIELAQGVELSQGFDQARDRYVDACEWYPDNGRVWLAYSIALLRAGSEDAIECIEQTLSLAPSTVWELDDGQAWFDIGYALLEANDEGGIVCLEQAIVIDESLTDEAMHLADAFADRKEQRQQPVSAAAEPQSAIAS